MICPNSSEFALPPPICCIIMAILILVDIYLFVGCYLAVHRECFYSLNTNHSEERAGAGFIVAVCTHLVQV